MKESKFIGRKLELDRLNALYNKKSLVVIKGRRRIGKSRLINEFAKTRPFWNFAGLAPEEPMTAQDQRDYFARQLSLLLKIPPLTFTDWADAFEHLSFHIKPGDIVLLDEISWMAQDDPTFIPKLKAWWDKQSTPVVLVLCGSVSIWIEENILKSTAFFGRINLTLTLEPLSIQESAELLKTIGVQSSDYETYRLLSVLGGIPWYLTQIDPTISGDENIKRLAFEKDGLLVLEFDRIFHDLFNGKGTIYKKILDALKEGTKTLKEIRQHIAFPHSGALSAFMQNLITAGFVEKGQLWSFKTHKALKQSLYRVSDPYLRFYLKVIEPHLDKITLGEFKEVAISTIPGLNEHMGLQLESLLLQNRPLLLKALGITPIDIVRSGPYRQQASTTQKGCQIDYLIQTTTNTLFVCEFKFRKREISSDIIQEMQDKISALKVPRGFSAVPVLFHLGGVSSAVATKSYFYRIIDIGDFLG